MSPGREKENGERESRKSWNERERGRRIGSVGVWEEWKGGSREKGADFFVW